MKHEIFLPTVAPVLAAKLPEPILDQTTKSEKKDEPITVEQIEDEGWLDAEQIAALKERTVSIYKTILDRADSAGFILADLKLEFGFDEEENIILADSVGPDEFRLWPKESYAPGKVQESYDKQPVRDWLSRIGYKKTLDKARSEGQPVPSPPKLPADLVQEISKRYILAYERLTGHKL